MLADIMLADIMLADIMLGDAVAANAALAADDRLRAGERVVATAGSAKSAQRRRRIRAGRFDHFGWSSAPGAGGAADKVDHEHRLAVRDRRKRQREAGRRHGGGVPARAQHAALGLPPGDRRAPARVPGDSYASSVGSGQLAARR